MKKYHGQIAPEPTPIWPRSLVWMRMAIAGIFGPVPRLELLAQMRWLEHLDRNRGLEITLRAKGDL